MLQQIVRIWKDRTEACELWLVPPILAVLLLTSGCVPSRPTQFYLLAPDITAEPIGAGSSVRDIVLGVGPIDLPAYLDRNQIVTRSDRTKLELSDFHHWAESLQENFQIVLAENLSGLLQTNRIIAYPWELDDEVNLQVGMRVLRFESGADNQVELVAIWLVWNPEEEESFKWNKSEIQIPVAGGSYVELTRAMSEAVAELSHEIAETIVSVMGKEKI